MKDDQTEIHVFYDSIEPSDIKDSCVKSVLNNDYFLSALAILAMRPPLIERIFVTKEHTNVGIYRIRICKNGVW